ncbi:fibronectin type III domain-containing protein [Paenibacillus curdlanolyticus]|uniref:fibronectin type III domain-containing protein n=1 Tax=Paenibacillus curdlanolyticus TaxID=59840 RepID=UPI000314B25D|nr:fibronectin type III domain-containing protein [Paenibacillus curdlanolyticus]
MSSIGAAGAPSGGALTNKGNAGSNALSVSALAAETVTAPTGLRSTVSTTTSITLVWSPSTSTAGTIARYEIYNGAALAGTSTTTTYRVMGLTADQAYTFSVKAVDSAGNISASSSSVTVYAVADANEPDNTAATALPINYGTLYFSMISSSTDVDYYKFTALSSVNHVTVSVPSIKNYDVILYDSAMNVVASGTKPTGEWEEVTFPVTPGNVYYIKVLGVSGQYMTAIYQLYLSQVVKQYVYNSPGQLLQTYVQKGLYRHQTDMLYDSNGNLTRKLMSKQILGYRDMDTSPAYSPFDNAGYSGLIGLDANNRSVSVDLGSSRGIAKAELTDSDNTTRLSQGNYVIYKSNDNITYTAVTGWLFSASVVNGRMVHAFTFNGLSARYLRITTNFADASPTFYIKLQDDMKLYLNS